MDTVSKVVDSLELPVGNEGKEYVVVDGSVVNSDKRVESEFVTGDVSDPVVCSVEE